MNYLLTIVMVVSIFLICEGCYTMIRNKIGGASTLIFSGFYDVTNTKRMEKLPMINLRHRGN